MRVALIDAGIHAPRQPPEPDPVLELPAHWRFLEGLPSIAGDAIDDRKQSTVTGHRSQNERHD